MDRVPGMNKLEYYLDAFKSKKLDALLLYGGMLANSPHRMAGANISGTISMTEDQREHTSQPYTAYLRTLSADFSTFPAFNRRFIQGPKVWYPGGPFGVDPAFADSDFSLGQDSLYRPWNIVGGGDNSATIGTITRKKYTLTGEDETYEEVESEDFDAVFQFRFSIGPLSGQAKITFILYFENMYGMLMSPWFDYYPDVTRNPKTDAWDSVELPGTLATQVTARNTQYGGGYSGSCSLTLNFT